MKYLLKAEAAAQFALVILLLSRLPVHFSWWAWILLFLSPDISMAGYLLNTRVGAYMYNLFHHQLVAIALWVAGVATGMVWIQLAGLLLWGHSNFDRMLGYGLKYNDAFEHTHLGMVGKGADMKSPQITA